MLAHSNKGVILALKNFLKNSITPTITPSVERQKNRWYSGENKKSKVFEVGGHLRDF